MSQSNLAVISLAIAQDLRGHYKEHFNALGSSILLVNCLLRSHNCGCTSPPFYRHYNAGCLVDEFQDNTVQYTWLRSR